MKLSDKLRELEAIGQEESEMVRSGAMDMPRLAEVDSVRNKHFPALLDVAKAASNVDATTTTFLEDVMSEGCECDSNTPDAGYDEPCDACRAEHALDALQRISITLKKLGEIE